MLIDVAQEFVQEITDLSSKLAHHRGSDTLMVKDAVKIAGECVYWSQNAVYDDPKS